MLLPIIDDVIFDANTDLTSLSTMKLKASGPLAIVKSITGLKTLLHVCGAKHIAYRIIGLGSNLLLKTTTDLLLIKLKFDFDRNFFEQQQENYILPANIPLHWASAHAVKFGVRGWECFTGIPASLGGAVAMNAGTSLGEIGDITEKVWILSSTGDERVVTIEDKNRHCYFSYRKNHFLEPGDIITQVQLKFQGCNPYVSETIRRYLSWRVQTQPLKENTCGCTFKNLAPTIRAGHYIDLIGLKGLTAYGFRVSPKHANFIEHLGGGTFDDFQKFLTLLEKEIYLHTQQNFPIEIEFCKTTSIP